MPLAIPIEKATNEEEFQAYEVRKQEAEAKGLKYVEFDYLISSLL